MTKYVALLRKVNVGGINLIKMDALRRVFEEAGLKNVRTFQQAGNVVFETRAKNPHKLLPKFLNTDLKAIIFTVDELERIAKHDPFKKIESGDVMLCVVFLFDKPAQTPKLPLKSTTENLE